MRWTAPAFLGVLFSFHASTASNGGTSCSTTQTIAACCSCVPRIELRRFHGTEPPPRPLLFGQLAGVHCGQDGRLAVRPHDNELPDRGNALLHASPRDDSPPHYRRPPPPAASHRLHSRRFSVRRLQNNGCGKAAEQARSTHAIRAGRHSLHLRRMRPTYIRSIGCAERSSSSCAPACSNADRLTSRRAPSFSGARPILSLSMDLANPATLS